MKTCTSGSIKIFIAGNVQRAKQICQKYVEKGACVNVVETEYIYKYGAETGVIVEFISYPRFPKPFDELFEDAKELADLLLNGLYAGSYTISSSGWFTYEHNTNYFFDRR